MFVRKWSALPADPEFPSDLKGLGYFINKDDEVRSIENEDNYFKYFISRNMRVNDRQRFAMNQAIQDEIHKRLTDLGLSKLFLPQCTTSAPSGPNVPIFVSPDLAKKSRVVIIFGEIHQDLGVLAHRILGGPGGIDKGSLVSVVKVLLQQRCSPADATAPGIILANMGELVWWPEGGRTLSKYSFDSAPMRSAAHLGNYVDPKVNYVPGNETCGAHVKYIFEKVVPDFVNPTAGLDIIGLGDGADVVETYLNNNETWERIAGRINCFASVGGHFPVWELKCDGLQEFLKDRTRAYVPSLEPLGMVLSGPDGNSNTTTFTELGCPVFSAGEPLHVETLFIASHTTVLDWLQEVADTSSKTKPYKNPMFTVVYSDGHREDSEWDCEEDISENCEEDISSTIAEVDSSEDEGVGDWLVIPGDNVMASKEADQKKAGNDEQGGESMLGKVSSSTLSALKTAMAATTIKNPGHKA
ncbi:Arb2 domain-containing protein [Xylaria flabelliformis]|nr:Arb2 domain-containing protein [Xylaria flabelliformis]